MFLLIEIPEEFYNRACTVYVYRYIYTLSKTLNLIHITNILYKNKTYVFVNTP